MADQNKLEFKNQQLLSAYLDGELGAADRALAESLIRKNPHYAQLVEQWRESGIDLRALPKYSLGHEFTDRVLDEVEKVEQLKHQSKLSSQPHQNVEAVREANSNVGSATPVAKSSEQTRSRLALVAIGVLCAWLLLTLFALPALFKPQPEASIAAKVAQPATAKIPAEAPDVGSTITDSDTLPVVETISNDLPSALFEGPIQRVPRGMVLKNTQDSGGEVAALTVSEPRQNVEQMLYVELGSDNEHFDIEKVLTNNSIKTVGVRESSTDKELSDVEAICVVASLDQMHRAAEQMADEFSAKVTIVPVPATAINAGSATRLESRRFNSESTDPEIVQLNEWFGLSAGDDSGSIRFLILLKR